MATEKDDEAAVVAVGVVVVVSEATEESVVNVAIEESVVIVPKEESDAEVAVATVVSAAVRGEDLGRGVTLIGNLAMTRRKFSFAFQLVMLAIILFMY